jgi:hypothetical protein
MADAFRTFVEFGGDLKKVLPYVCEYPWQYGQEVCSAIGDADVLSPYFDHGVWKSRAGAIRCYSFLGGEPKAIIPFLADADWHVRYAAVLGHIEAGGNPFYLTPLFDDDNYEIRDKVIPYVVERIGWPTEIEEEDVVDPLDLLPRSWDKEERERVRELAVGGYINRGGDPSRLVPLFEDENAEVRRQALEGYIELGGKQPELLEIFFDDADDDLMAIAFEGFATLKGDSQILLPYLNRFDATISRAAIDSFKRLTY